MPLIRVVIADDHDMVRRGLRGLIESKLRYRVVGEASDGREALAVVGDALPDVVILDYSLPLMDGLSVARKLKETHPRIEIVMFTLFDQERVVTEAIDIGVLGFVLLVFGFLNLIVGAFGVGFSPLWVGGNLGLGALLLLIAGLRSIESLRERIASGGAKRAGRYGSSAILSTVFALAILWMLAFLATRYPTRFDWSEQRVHSLSDQTTKLLAGLDGRGQRLGHHRRHRVVVAHVDAAVAGDVADPRRPAHRDGQPHLRQAAAVAPVVGLRCIHRGLGDLPRDALAADRHLFGGVHVARPHAGGGLDGGGGA